MASSVWPSECRHSGTRSRGPCLLSGFEPATGVGRQGLAVTGPNLEPQSDHGCPVPGKTAPRSPAIVPSQTNREKSSSGFDRHIGEKERQPLRLRSIISPPAGSIGCPTPPSPLQEKNPIKAEIENKYPFTAWFGSSLFLAHKEVLLCNLPSNLAALPQAPSTPPDPAPPPQSSHKPKRQSKTKTAPPPESPRPPPPIQPYPQPAYSYMSPPYPLNASPFVQAPYGQAPPPPGPMGPGMPGQPPPHHQGYGYPMHHQYPPHPAYSPYAQYPPHMMMYPPAQHPPRPGPDVGSPYPPEDPSMSKRKRAGDSARGSGASDDEAHVSSEPSHSRPTGVTSASVIDMKKRTKTQRACDSCRSRKIRCDLLTDVDPPACQHCKQYGFECTFFLPITETRFKRKKTEDDHSHDKSGKGRRTSSPSHDQNGNHTYGLTSVTHLIHSQATINARLYESFDLRHNHTWSVAASGDGLIQIKHSEEAAKREPVLPKPIELKVEPEMMQQLVNAYFTDLAPLLPVITREELLSTPSPPPILLYSIALVAAARREVSHNIFDSLRHQVQLIIRSEDVLSNASIANVQALLILCMTGDSHSQFVPHALSSLWIRLGTAIRMAQDLGLHRAESVKQDIDLRRRLWSACVISDRWTGLAYGHPYMIDVHDCDARLPSAGNPNDLYMDEMTRLSVILGRVLKTIYSPSGLTMATDEMLQNLLNDLESWKKNLPEGLRYTGVESSLHAGILHMCYVVVSVIFWRVFMRISYTCPAHLKMILSIEQWQELINLTAEVIEWLDTHERLYDVWLVVAYAAVACALVQYHTWVRRRDAAAQGRLKQLRDTVHRWEDAISPEHLSTRRKTAEIITLLYEATLGEPLPAERPPLNPTGGVTARPPTDKDLVYKEDPTRPGTGVYVAERETMDKLRGVPGIVAADDTDGKAGQEAVAAVTDGTSGGVSAPTSDARGAPPPLVSSPSSFVAPLPGDGVRGGVGVLYANNVNPAMNANGNQESVQVMNMLGTGTLETLAQTDTGFLEGIPGGMFDWSQWDTYFLRFAGQQMSDGNAAAARGEQQFYGPVGPPQQANGDAAASQQQPPAASEASSAPR